jgi:hypothetical protein
MRRVVASWRWGMGAMGRYYFHIRQGQLLIPDEEGMDCRDLIAVQAEACASAQDLAMAALRSYEGYIPGSVEVEDEQGNAVQDRAAPLWMH